MIFQKKRVSPNGRPQIPIKICEKPENQEKMKKKGQKSTRFFYDQPAPKMSVFFHFEGATQKTRKSHFSEVQNS